MLVNLRIKNIAVIDEAEIPFEKGLNILSGETGAGKSIIIEAISLLLGGRASSDLVRAGCDEATVEGLFDINDIPWIQDRLAQFGFERDVPQLLIKRVVTRTARHRTYVNGEMATVSILQELCTGLIDLCGQNEHQSLVRPATQMALVDRYGSLEKQARMVSEILSGVRSLRTELEQVETSEQDRQKREDFIRFQVDELKAAGLQPGEDSLLQAEKKLYQTAEQRLQLSQSILDVLEGPSSESGSRDVLKSMQSKLRTLAAIDPGIQSCVDHMDRALAELGELTHHLQKYSAHQDYDPVRLETIQERLARIADLRRKYGATVEEMIAQLSKLEGELQSFAHHELRAQELQAKLESSEMELLKEGKKLSQQRRKVASVLSDSISAELSELCMVGAHFSVRLRQRDDLKTWTSAFGADEIDFLVKTNVGEAEKPIGKIASGGELSRLTLAIRHVIADRGGIGVYLFDEIDAGIGGQTALQVGKKLKEVAKYNQVICITHLAQVASFADQHLTVRKTVKSGRTLTDIQALNAHERKKELTRMMGGAQMTKILEKTL